jgi:transcriptional regulator with XRE-family HTH domain
VDKSIFTPHYDAFRARIVKLRKDAGLTQRQLAERMRRPRSFVSRIEQGERRLDVIEFFWLCRACGVDPVAMAAAVMNDALAIDRTSRRSKGQRGSRRKSRS